MKKFYPFRVFDSRLQVDYIYPKKRKLFEKIRVDLIIANFFASSFRNWMVSVAKKLIQIKVFWMNLENFMKKYNLKGDSMTGSEIKIACNSVFCPRGIKKFTSKGFVNIDNGEQGGTQ